MHAIPLYLIVFVTRIFSIGMQGKGPKGIDALLDVVDAESPIVQRTYEPSACAA